MKQIRIVIHEPTINKVIGRELNLSLGTKATLVAAINEVDKLISHKGRFPVADYRSLLHMVYNSIENRFYNQVAVSAYQKSGKRLDVREDPKKELPEGTTVTLIPAGGCITAWEEALNYEEFVRALSECVH